MGVLVCLFGFVRKIEGDTELAQKSGEDGDHATHKDEWTF